MAKFLATQIKLGKLTIEQVPEKYLAAVKEELKQYAILFFDDCGGERINAEEENTLLPDQVGNLHTRRVTVDERRSYG